MKYRLSDDWEQLVDNREIVVYGFGELAHLYLPKMMQDFKVRYIIDNDVRKSEMTYCGAIVKPFNDLKDTIKNKKIVIFAGTNIAENLRETIKKYLSEQGLKEYVDFCDIERFALEWYWRFEKRVHVFQIHTAITTKCTLKCKKCNMFIPYYKNNVEYSVSDIKKNLDAIFQYAEYVFKYQLVGGEPFLHKDIYEILRLIGEEYGSRISWKRIVTNGTVLPSEDVLRLLKKYEYDVVISDYTQQIPYHQKINLLEEKLQEYQITYHRECSLNWVDIGLPDALEGIQRTDAKKHMENCASSWHGLADGKLYYCNVAWSAEKCGFFKNEAGDYIDLISAEKEKSFIQESLVALSLGELYNGCNTLCKYCKGCGTDNIDIIPAGEQL